MSDIRDFSGKNRKFTGTDGIKLPVGTQAQRVNVQGQLRFNTNTNLAEYYDGTEWKPIDAPPTLTAVSPAAPVDDGSTETTITITGSNLQSGGSLSLIGNDATSYAVSSFTRVSSSSITFTYTSALAAAGVNTPYDVRYENPSGLAAVLEDGFTPNTAPTFVSPSAGASLGSINLGANASTLTQISVTDTSGGTLVYSISAGALPGGASINSSTGAISGVTNASGTFNFTVQVTDGTTAVTRAFSCVIINPFAAATGGTVLTSGDYKTHVFTSPGDFIVSAAGPSANSVEYLVVAGGAGGSGSHGGGGGAGGMRENYPSPATGGLPISVQTYPVTVGGGGAGKGPGPGNSTNIRGGSGGQSVFSTITSAGGGGGAYSEDGNRPGDKGVPGGSGGGGGHGGSGGGSGNTPSVSPPQGNNGGGGHGGPRFPGGGGGGKGTSGQSTGSGNSGGGTAGVGEGIATAFFGPTSGSYGTPGPSGSNRYFAGGGGGGVHSTNNYANGGYGGGGRGQTNNASTASNKEGTTNTGGGGGGSNGQAQTSGSGGSGFVAIRYKFQ